MTDSDPERYSKPYGGASFSRPPDHAVVIAAPAYDPPATEEYGVNPLTVFVGAVLPETMPAGFYPFSDGIDEAHDES